MNPKVRELWRQYLAETDPLSREILYVAYMRALTQFHPNPLLGS